MVACDYNAVSVVCAAVGAECLLVAVELDSGLGAEAYGGWEGYYAYAG